MDWQGRRMKKCLVFSDGVTRKLVDITYDEFVFSDLYNSGSSDIGISQYEKYKRRKDMYELEDFAEEALEGAVVVLGDE